ncbi:hypothetical protein HNQ91_002257 [Filimonas zeae]|uniref:LuxE/PaaK family acyltransferase n=1 Tax=Filimonas zeae TaxID=1737353 RepID=UPI00166ADDEB|nr:acyl transferase [Filimonas zeae]MDR6339206.1 hypothetical protein [Filimonas zeae]
MPNLDKTINIFQDTLSLPDAALQLFNIQYQRNPVYKQWCDTLKVAPENVQDITQIPFLPVSFFKTRQVVCGSFEPEALFESSGTTQTVNSRHLVKELALYEQSCVAAFEREYGAIAEWCVIGLLPAYLERKNSSLVHMVNQFIAISAVPESGFYLYEYDKLYHTLQQLEARGQKTLLIGVTFGLLDFAEAHTMQLQHTVVMETGGMKGRRRELTREEVHGFLTERLGVPHIHSEYGMTELLSQAYSKGAGLYRCPPWMKIVVRDEEDPLLVREHGRGVINIIDLANRDSCAFIATDDVGIVYEDGSFEVRGRMDVSDIRGCSLLMV